MADAEMPFVAVIGGLWQLDLTAAASAKATAKAIGAELAKQGFGLVAYFSNDESLEPHVVAGYVAALGKRRGDIRVRYPESQRGKVRFAEEANRTELFHHWLFPGTDWEAPFYRSLAEEEGVDGVLLLAGSTSTLIAGQIALARRLPVLAVNEFGGSGGKIWSQIAQASPERAYPAWGTRPPAAFVSQLKTECAALLARRHEARRRDQLLSTMLGRRQQAGYTAGAFVTLLLTLILGLTNFGPPDAYTVLMLLGLVAAGATGALVRAVLWGTDEVDPRGSLVLGAIAGAVVGLAYLVPQWVGAPGVLQAGAEVSATDKIRFVSAVLVAVSAGVGFETVFGRLKKQAHDLPIATDQ